ncbi:MAG TPA: AAA family ATPase [Candidatus Deferrimicrobiaceae bacterium]|nr:AAA family ATPase [Candidatus Deferrimicrobiaceae bacterium]
MTALTMQQEQGLAVARLLVKAGMPLFLAHPNPSSLQGFSLPMGWQHLECDPSVVDAWRPGMALCAVTGRAFDLVDIDPRSGGDESLIELPHSYLAAETPSGGRHHFVSALGVASRDGVAPGVDLKSGTLEGTGRGFAFIAPTVRVSKVDGVAREYRWYLGPDGPGLPSADQRAADGSGAKLRGRVMELRRTQPQAVAPRRVPLSVARREFQRAMHGLRDSVRGWMTYGWGGQAHSDILAATTHLARLNAEQAEAAFLWAFRDAGAEPDEADLQKLYSAIERAVPDVVVPDEQLDAQERFWLGGDSPLDPGVFGGGTGLTAMTPGSGTSSTGEPRRRFGAMDEFEAQNIVPPAPIVDGMLLSGTKARLSAPSGAGKTWVVLDIAAHIANGIPWQGKPTVRTKVLYVAGEGAPSFGTRMATWRAAHSIPTGVLLEPEAPQIATAEWDEFVEFYADQAVGLFIFDTQGSITIGLKENDNDHANVLHARLGKLISKTGAAVLLVHHTGWEETTRARGASAAFGGMDTELSLAQDGGSGLRVTMHDGKQRYIERGKPVRLALESAHGGRVVTGSGGTTTSPGGGVASFFDDTEVRIQAVVARLQAHAATGQTWTPKVAPTVRVLRDELDVQGDDKTMLRPAARRYLASIGYTEFLTDSDRACG